MAEDAGNKILLNGREEIELVQAAQRRLASSLDHSHPVSIALIDNRAESQDGQAILRLPPQVLRMFADMLGALAQGKTVSIVPKELDLTTQEAAIFLNVSRPHLVKLLERGEIAFHKVGSHRRITLDEAMRYKDERYRASQTALQALADQAQELDMGY
ncbi:helix-turn-helix domain-containing protein [Pseudoduganella aquatica]|uniref:helix-turn-helix domain-containing protein n=1 Tax=Pseudoduganella aquatica TaxID=2660641 RepID=UPI001E60538A|nr:helix-turn-helix domain-containing protein [Pseudoduganella aquatica]